MKKTRYIILIIFISLFAACTKDKEQPILKPEESSNYYIKYEVQFSTQGQSADKELTVTTANGVKIIRLSGSNGFGSTWSATYGPVERGYIASILCDYPNSTDQCNFYTKISISKDNEPFAIKSEEQGKSIALYYTIK